MDASTFKVDPGIYAGTISRSGNLQSRRPSICTYLAGPLPVCWLDHGTGREGAETRWENSGAGAHVRREGGKTGCGLAARPCGMYPARRNERETIKGLETRVGLPIDDWGRGKHRRCCMTGPAATALVRAVNMASIAGAARRGRCYWRRRFGQEPDLAETVMAGYSMSLVDANEGDGPMGEMERERERKPCRWKRRAGWGGGCFATVSTAWGCDS